MLAENSVLTLISLYRSIKLQVVHKFLSNFTFYTEALPIIAYLHIPRNNLYLEGLWGGGSFLPNWVAISDSAATHALLAIAGTEVTMRLQAWNPARDDLTPSPALEMGGSSPSKLEGSGFRCLPTYSLVVGSWTSYLTFQSLQEIYRVEMKITLQGLERHKEVT